MWRAGAERGRSESRQAAITCSTLEFRAKARGLSVGGGRRKTHVAAMAAGRVVLLVVGVNLAGRVAALLDPVRWLVTALTALRVAYRAAQCVRLVVVVRHDSWRWK